MIVQYTLRSCSKADLASYFFVNLFSKWNYLGTHSQKAHFADSFIENKEQQTAEGKANGNGGSLSHLISKRDVITDNSASNSVRRNITSPAGKVVM